MRTREEVRDVLRLAGDGLGAGAIARRTGIPRTTVLRWITAGPPRFDDPQAATCAVCGHAAHHDVDGAAYSYLLGLYLGDGHHAYSRYTFSNRSEDIKGIFCEHLDLLGIAWRRAGEQTISISRREAVAALDEFVGPKR